MSGNFNVVRLSRLERQAESGHAALRGVLDLLDAQRVGRNHLKAEALRVTPIPFNPHRPMSELAGLLEAEHQRLCKDPKVHPGHEHQCRAALAAVLSVLDMEARISALEEETKRMNTQNAPLKQLVRACQNLIGRDGFIILGKAAT